MRTFDYLHLPQNLFDGAIGDANVLLHEDKGMFDALRQEHPERASALQGQAFFDNVEASLHIEGLYADSTRIRAIVDGSEPSGDIEEQAAGYATALRAIGQNADGLTLSTPTILAFHKMLYPGRDVGRKSSYRKKDYLYVQVDGHPQAMPVSPIAAFETPLVLGGACDSLEGAFVSGTCSAVILAAVFTVDFLCIRPFDEGNGRLSRLFADLMLTKAGFDIARYVSIDRVIEGSAMDYYSALNACVEGWDRGGNDYRPFALYWMQALHETYQQAIAAMRGSTATGSKSERVRAFVREARRAVSKREILNGIGNVSEATVEAELGRMVKEGVAEKVGAGRSTAYLWRNDA